eukprot:TRINITY_DN11938_c4_g1_i6.p2 TRINITY_DN11938_c4_g1~~TRINITY_DN11938_c4_g1_i6.p2  ORF type:complete len:125 (+),score=26.16 TRINITY_DN11938_c4_g1_i6:280-654(+)
MNMSIGASEAIEPTSLMVDSSYWLTVTVLLCAMAVGSVGLLPILLIPAAKLKAKADNILEAPWLRTMLGMACGGLLGNVFLHLLPEAMMLASKQSLQLQVVTGNGCREIAPFAAIQKQLIAIAT